MDVRLAFVGDATFRVSRREYYERASELARTTAMSLDEAQDWFDWVEASQQQVQLLKRGTPIFVWPSAGWPRGLVEPLVWPETLVAMEAAVSRVDISFPQHLPL